MSQANHDHASALPTEIWLQIITHVPRATLHSLTKVNRALRQISLPVFLETLDLAPFRRRASHTLALRRGEDMSDRNAEWEALIQWRLHLAQTIPSAVRAVHLLPYHGSVEYVYPTQGFLERTVRSTLRSLVGLELNFVADRISLTTLQDHIENIFISIIPSLVNVHELHIRNDIQYHTPSINLRRCRSIDTAWASWASRLTLLAVDVSNAWDIDHWFPPPIDGNESTCYTLPLLRTYRVHFRAAEPVSNPGVAQAVFDLIRHSPLLEEVEYFLYKAPWGWERIDFMLPQIDVHPKLRSFTRSRVPSLRGPVQWGYFTPTAVETCLSQYASQLLSVHLDPSPESGLSYLLQPNTSPLIELRLNLAFVTHSRELFGHLSELQHLRILELNGRWPVMNGNSNLRRMELLEELYLPIRYQYFNLQSLYDMATKTPNLQKLVLRFQGELQFEWDPPSRNPSFWPQGLREFQTATISLDGLDNWKVKDFGVYVPGTEIDRLHPVVEAIARHVPSIKSFYGTGTLIVPAMVSVDPDWFGKLK